MARKSNRRKIPEVAARKKAKGTIYTPTPCIIGIDQSYTNTGIAIAVGDQLKRISNIPLDKIKSKTLKREKVAKVVGQAIQSCLKHYQPNEVTIIVERIRVYSQGFSGTKNMSMPFIKSQAALITTIVDTAFHYGVRVYSVDTRAWKNRILGTSKPLAIAFPGCKNPKKIREVKYIVELGFADQLKCKNHKDYDDDRADAACIALYGNSGEPYMLKLEE